LLEHNLRVLEVLTYNELVEVISEVLKREAMECQVEAMDLPVLGIVEQQWIYSLCPRSVYSGVMGLDASEGKSTTIKPEYTPTAKQEECQQPTTTETV